MQAGETVCNPWEAIEIGRFRTHLWALSLLTLPGTHRKDQKETWNACCCVVSERMNNPVRRQEIPPESCSISTMEKSLHLWAEGQQMLLLFENWWQLIACVGREQGIGCHLIQGVRGVGQDNQEGHTSETQGPSASQWQRLNQSDRDFKPHLPLLWWQRLDKKWLQNAPGECVERHSVSQSSKGRS